MRISHFHKIIFLMVVILMTVFLSGCSLLDFLFANEVKQTSNIFNFDSYDTLEISISENEKFVLQKQSDLEWNNIGQTGYSGYGEWINNDLAIPVCFIESWDNDYSDKERKVVRYFEVFYDKEKLAYFDLESKAPEVYLHSRIMRAFNDADNPRINWCNQQEKDSWDKEDISVKYTTYERNPNDKWEYVSDDWWFFINNNGNAVYRCEEWGFNYDTQTDSGLWSVNGKEIPIKIEFETDISAMKIYDLSEESKCIFDGKQAVFKDNNSVTFKECTQTMFYKDTKGEMVLKKEYK